MPIDREKLREKILTDPDLPVEAGVSPASPSPTPPENRSTKMSATQEITLEDANAVIVAHREAEYAKRVAEAKPFIGRYFKYRNSYGPTDKWWLYGLVTEITEVGWPKGLTFQRTSDNRVEVRTDDSIHIQSGGWKEITAREFQDAATAIRDDMIARLTPPFGVQP